MPAENFIKYSNWLGISPDVGERNSLGVLPQHFADMFGWENMAEQVAKVYNSLPPEEQQKCGIFTINYGEAGAIDFSVRKWDFPLAAVTTAIGGGDTISPRTEIMIVVGGDMGAICRLIMM